MRTVSAHRALAILLLASMYSPVSADETRGAFVISDGTADFKSPRIVVQHNAERNTGVDWANALTLHTYDGSDAARLRNAVEYLHEGIRKVSRQSLEIVSSNDVSTGIVLTTLAAAPELAAEQEVITALRNDGTDAYNDREAFFLRSEPQRLLIVANTVDGLIAAVPELLESVGYEVLGMGPDWMHVPGEDGPLRDSKLRPLSFNIKKAGRAGYYYRALVATSGQHYGVGTIYTSKLSDPADETVDVSYKRWQIGTRMHGMSMPGFHR